MLLFAGRGGNVLRCLEPPCPRAGHNDVTALFEEGHGCGGPDLPAERANEKKNTVRFISQFASNNESTTDSANSL